MCLWSYNNLGGKLSLELSCEGRSYNTFEKQAYDHKAQPEIKSVWFFPREENPLWHSREPTHNSTHTWPWPGLEPGSPWWEVSALRTSQPCPLGGTAPSKLDLFYLFSPMIVSSTRPAQKVVRISLKRSIGWRQSSNSEKTKIWRKLSIWQTRMSIKDAAASNHGNRGSENRVWLIKWNIVSSEGFHNFNVQGWEVFRHE